VVCRLSSIRRMAESLAVERAQATAPTICMKLDASSSLVRSYFQIGERMPSHLEGLRGSGVVGLSRAGRQRFPEFPQIIAIEEFIRASLKPREFATLENTRSHVTPPATFA